MQGKFEETVAIQVDGVDFTVEQGKRRFVVRAQLFIADNPSLAASHMSVRIPVSLESSATLAEIEEHARRYLMRLFDLKPIFQSVS